MFTNSVDGVIGFAIDGVDIGNRTGAAVSNAGDVNGDRFDDLLIGSGSYAATTGKSYLVFGGNRTGGTETQVGDDEANSLTANQGAASPDILIGGRNNDTLVSDGGPDALRGGEGNDTLAIPDADFSGMRRLEGGNGSDTLRLDGSGITLDLTAVPDNRLTGIEQIDIRGDGDNSLTLSVQKVLNVSDESNTLQIIKDAEDSVDIGTGWTLVGGETVGDESFSIFERGAAVLFVSTGQPVARSTVPLPVAGEYRLVINNGNIEIQQGPSTIVATLGPGTGLVVINGSSDDDNLIIDFSNGNPIPSGGLTFNGGSQTTADTLTFAAANVTSVEHHFTNASDGSVNVELNGVTSLINYTGLEPIFDNLSAVDRTFEFGSTDDNITVSDLGGSVSRIESTSSSETVDFVNPTGSLTINSGKGDDTIDASASGVAVIANSGRGFDSLVGSPFNDQLNGGTGSDTLTGGLGDDLLNGGSFNIDFPNVISESSDTDFTLSDDTLTSPLTGTDTLISLEAARLVGGAGANTINAENVSEPVTLLGGSGDDTITGAAASSIINGNGGADLLIGGPSNDTIYAGSGNDIVSGNGGADRILGNGGIDTLSGNAGDDTLSGQGGNDILQGGDGTDRIRESGNSNFTLNDSTSASSVSGTDSLNSIEESSFTGGSSNNLLDASTFSGSVLFAGGGGRDTIHGALGGSRLNGNSGNDSLIGQNSDDTIYGGGEQEQIDGGAGNDRIFGHGGRDLIVGNDGDDTIKGGSSSDTISGGLGDDEVRVDSGNDNLSGDADNDLIDGQTGNDTVSGNEGDDTVTGSFGSDTVFGNAENDILSGSQLFGLGSSSARAAGGSVSDIDRVDGGDGNDQIFNRNGTQTTLGGAGNDTIRGVGGSDLLSGNDGDDLIVARGDFENGVVLGQTMISGGPGNDTIEGSIGDDQFSGDAGDDLIDGAIGNDTISGGVGNDQLIGNDGDDLLTESADTDFNLGDASLTSPTVGIDSLSGIERVFLQGGLSANSINASGFSGSVTLLGGARNDTLTGAAGSSIINGNGDNDVLSGGNSNDTIFGGSGNDTITGGSGGDRLIGNFGRDTITTDPADTVVGRAGDIIL